MDYLIHLIQSAGYWGYAVLFLVLFWEHFPPSSFLPGDSLLFTTGFLASQGYFDITILFIVLFFGSVLGYIFSYFIGRKLRSIILSQGEVFWLKRKHLDYTERFYAKYGLKTVIIGRFIPVVRSFGPTLAGAVGMPYHKFMKYNIIGAIFWTGGLSSIGFYLGRIIPRASVHLTPIILVIIFVSLIPAVFEYISESKSIKQNK